MLAKATTLAAAAVLAFAPCQEAVADDVASLAPLSVTATRVGDELADPSASLTTFDESDVRTSAARTLDDLLRSVPGFNLFRRSSSVVAHPTSQGVSLRGIGATGASRALVLVDGVPANDPFGGQVYWGKIALGSVERVEILRGSASSLWGNYAMGGVVQVLTRAPDRDSVHVVAEGGERGSAELQSEITRRGERTGVVLDGDYFRTDGYPVVKADQRGAIDVPADSEHGVVGARVDYRLSPRATMRMQARGFHEQRGNGTPYTNNETSSGFVRSGIDARPSGLGRVRSDVFVNWQNFDSTFSSQAADRQSEVPALDQYDVPSTAVGASSVWSGSPLRGHTAALGVDLSWIEGKTKEHFRYLDGTFARGRVAGGEQLFVGLFTEDLWSLTDRLDLSASLRLDSYATSDGFRRESDLADGSLVTDRKLAEPDQLLVNPRLGLAYAWNSNLSLRAAAYRGFRAPTLNELVRPFRVRNDITEANDTLAVERLVGVEGGADFERGPIGVSATLFWNEIDDPIFNVTVGAGPGVVDPCGFVPEGGVCRQRRNLGRTSIVGAETEVRLELGGGAGASLAYLWSDGEIRSAALDPALVGNRIPQVPRHQATFGLRYESPSQSGFAALQVRYVGDQFEDDANTRGLGGYFVVDAAVAREVAPGWEVFVKAENLFEREFATGESADGIVSIGAPRLVRGGLRYAFGAR